ncbi:MAG: molybdate ABC transporter substrate-binding protein [Coriobacteriales bacterium]|nr:molybdate ABC transporter substrate-binding protein [Coriobacteriales bacterium]
MLEVNRRAFLKGAALLSAATMVPASFALADAAQEKIKLQIFAANSLEKAMPKVQELFVAANPNVEFADTQFKASGDLVEQMIAGAEVDILITASKGTMDKAEENKLIDPATRLKMFNNDLVIVRAVDADITIDSIDEVADPDITSIAIGDAATVPAGKYANQSLYSVGLYTGSDGDNGEYDPAIADKINLADKVGTAASWVSTGDCQIGFVYSSDVYRYNGIEVAFVCPEDSHKAISYPGAVSAKSKNAEIAAEFLDFCMNDPDALEVWAEYGFEVAEEEAPKAAYADGTYKGTIKIDNADVAIAIEIKDGKVSNVTLG